MHFKELCNFHLEVFQVWAEQLDKFDGVQVVWLEELDSDVEDLDEKVEHEAVARLFQVLELAQGFQPLPLPKSERFPEAPS